VNVYYYGLLPDSCVVELGVLDKEFLDNGFYTLMMRSFLEVGSLSKG